jgi:hypothetical protein
MALVKPRFKPLPVEDADGGEPGRCQYSPRARRRLLIAARLMRLSWPICDADIAFFSRVLTSIRRLGQAQQHELRTLVDWVEDYETEEEVTAKGGRGPAASHPPRQRRY